MKDVSEDSVASKAAQLAGVFGLLYSVSFVLHNQDQKRFSAGLAGLFLMVGGVLVSIVAVSLFLRLQAVHRSLAVWALVVASFAALGAILHGGYDLANAIHQPTKDVLDLANYPNAVDPRGLLTFGFSGLALGGWAWLISKSGRFPANFVNLTWVLSVALAVIYVVRLFILNTKNPFVLVLAGATGLVLNPWWYIWLGKLLGTSQGEK